jgi:CheY-like chemotaxis protein
MEAIGTLAGGIAHDFNNMLGAMIGYATLAIQDIPDDNPAHTSIQEVLIAANRAKELVKQILTFGRESENEKQALMIRPIVREALKMFRATMPANIELRENIESKSSKVMANVNQIHQILLNLCTNAVHAMEENGGILEVSLDDIDVQEDCTIDGTLVKKGSYVRLKTSDTGKGISKDIIDRIFEPFFTTKQVGKGTGMGLSVIHGIMKKCDEAIGVQSEPGKGTSFSIFCPRLESEDNSDQASSGESDENPMAKILLVDDEKSLVDVTGKILERKGYSVVSKTGSIDALEAFRTDPDSFDLVITDHKMPHMTGAQLAKELIGIKNNISIIMCTGFSETLGPDEAKSIGIKQYLMKPVTIADLDQAIEQTLNIVETAA